MAAGTPGSQGSHGSGPTRRRWRPAARERAEQVHLDDAVERGRVGVRERAADGDPGVGDHHVDAAVITSYSATSTRRVARLNRSVEPGHSIGLRPAALRYQLTQPPVAQTVRAIRRSMSAHHRRCASALASSAAAPRSPRARSRMRR
jgi:hypothetical protein